MSIPWKRVISQEHFDNWHKQRNKMMDDILKDYEGKISDRLHSLERMSSYFPRIRDGSIDWGHHFNLPFKETDKNKDKARRQNIEDMKKEIDFILDAIRKYENILDSREKERKD